MKSAKEIIDEHDIPLNVSQENLVTEAINAARLEMLDEIVENPSKYFDIYCNPFRQIDPHIVVIEQAIDTLKNQIV